jgi:CRISPR/Cas system CMR-associated protein Cmr5 small subunit
MTTRDQERAKDAFEQSRKIDGKDADFAKKLPVLIQTCGLAQALAFAQAKDKARKLREALENWIAKTIPPEPQQSQLAANNKILARIIAAEPDFLFRATDEALAYLFWIGRFTEASEKKPRNGGGK